MLADPDDLITALEDAVPPGFNAAEDRALEAIGYKLWALREMRAELEAEAHKERRESRG